MTRREFIGATAAAVVASVLPASKSKPVMHCYENFDGEIIAAGSLYEAAHWHDCKLGDEPEPLEGWSQISDGARIPIRDDEKGIVVKTAAEWAEECASPGEPNYVASTYC